MVTEAGVPLRLLFFGTPEFAVPSLERLLHGPHDVVAVVTQPDRPRGRGYRNRDAPVKAVARARGLEILQPTKLLDPVFLARLAAFRADLGVVAAYGRILPEAVLRTPRLGLINVHASLLPTYRGAAPIQRAVINGERQTGITIMRIVQELDAGPMLASATHDIGPDDTSVSVEHALARLGATLVARVLDDVAAGRVTETPQPESLATYAPRITRQDGALDWRAPAQRIHDHVRGLHPWPHAFTFAGNRRYLVLTTAVLDREPLSDVQPGTVVTARRDDLSVVAGDGCLVRILALQPEGRRPMSARDFLAGHALPVGTILHGEPDSTVGQPEG